MPKIRSQRSLSRAHSTSAKPVNRAFAAQENAVKLVDVGALKDVSADEILQSVDADDASHPQHATNKKERRILKHELFLERLEASRAPYSKSHARRLKRKEKEQLTGRLGSLKAALPSIAPTATRTAATVDERSAEEADAAAATNTHANTTTTTATAAGGGATVKPPTKPITSDPLEAPPPRPSRPGQIGEGKGAPLTRSQRRRALKAERFRQPLIRSYPEFAANPFETIRTHARNTLVPHKPTT